MTNLNSGNNIVQIFLRSIEHDPPPDFESVLVGAEGYPLAEAVWCPDSELWETEEGNVCDFLPEVWAKIPALKTIECTEKEVRATVLDDEGEP